MTVRELVHPLRVVPDQNREVILDVEGAPKPPEAAYPDATGVVVNVEDTVSITGKVFKE